MSVPRQVRQAPSIGSFGFSAHAERKSVRMSVTIPDAGGRSVCLQIAAGRVLLAPKGQVEVEGPPETCSACSAFLGAPGPYAFLGISALCVPIHAPICVPGVCWLLP